MPSDDLSAVQAGVDVKVMLTRRLAEALGEDSAIVDFDDLCDRVKAERVQTASCHVFECRNDRTADSPYCPAHTQITELLAAAPSPPVDRQALLAILADTYGMEGHPDHEHAADVLISAGVVRTPRLELDREELGRLVREVWIGWAREQPNPKPSWLVPWEDLSEPDREVDCRIGETLARAGISAGVVAQPPADDEVIDRVAAAIWGRFISNPHWDAIIEPEVRELWRDMARCALAAIAPRDSSREAGQPTQTAAYVCKCPGSGTHAHVRSCHQHPEAGQP